MLWDVLQLSEQLHELGPLVDMSAVELHELDVVSELSVFPHELVDCELVVIPTWVELHDTLVVVRVPSVELHELDSTGASTLSHTAAPAV